MRTQKLRGTWLLAAAALTLVPAHLFAQGPTSVPQAPFGVPGMPGSNTGTNGDGFGTGTGYAPPDAPTPLDFLYWRQTNILRSNTGTNGDGFETATGYAPPDPADPLPVGTTRPEDGGPFVTLDFLYVRGGFRKDGASVKWLAAMAAKPPCNFCLMGLLPIDPPETEADKRIRRSLAFPLLAIQESETALAEWLAREKDTQEYASFPLERSETRGDNP
jgi:hypothetical protein